MLNILKSLISILENMNNSTLFEVVDHVSERHFKVFNIFDNLTA